MKQKHTMTEPDDRALLSLLTQVVNSMARDLSHSDAANPVSSTQFIVLESVLCGIARPAQISASLGVSRQAVHQTIKELVTLGYIDLVEDIQDKRAKTAMLTAEGHRVLETAQAVLAEQEAEIKRLIGARDVLKLRSILLAIAK